MTKKMYTENQRRVITLIKRNGPMTKPELADKGRMGWATVVKVINQLLLDEVLTSLGKKKKTVKGKHAEVFDITFDKLQAIGIDIEVKTTRIILTNLKGDVFAEESCESPIYRSGLENVHFIRTLVLNFIEDKNINSSLLTGIGIGIPGLRFPLQTNRSNPANLRQVEQSLAQEFKTPVSIDTNTKAYAVFEKWSNETFAYTDFLFVSIRTGVGTGIFYEGKLYDGHSGFAGEIGHIKVADNKKKCRCGGYGCMETIVNQNIIYEKYKAAIGIENLNSPDPVSAELIVKDLPKLFTNAKLGNKIAIKIIKEFVYYLGKCLAYSINILDITNIIISAHFGADGDYIVEPLKKIIKKEVLPNTMFNIVYTPIDTFGYTYGAALLVMKDFFVDLPRN